MSSLQINPHGRFFSKLLSKEASAANSSSRLLYYGGTACSIPFLWETCPGTPRREMTTTSSYSVDSADECKFKPFLTPPPYYSSCSGSKPSENGREAKVRGGLRFLSVLVRKLGRKRSAQSPMCSVSSSKSSSSSSSSLLSSAASYPPRSPGRLNGLEKSMSCSCAQDSTAAGRTMMQLDETKDLCRPQVNSSNCYQIQWTRFQRGAAAAGGAGH